MGRWRGNGYCGYRTYFQFSCLLIYCICYHAIYVGHHLVLECSFSNAVAVTTLLYQLVKVMRDFMTTVSGQNPSFQLVVSTKNRTKLLMEVVKRLCCINIVLMFRKELLWKRFQCTINSWNVEQWFWQPSPLLFGLTE